MAFWHKPAFQKPKTLQKATTGSELVTYAEKASRLNRKTGAMDCVPQLCQQFRKNEYLWPVQRNKRKPPEVYGFKRFFKNEVLGNPNAVVIVFWRQL